MRGSTSLTIALSLALLAQVEASARAQPPSSATSSAPSSSVPSMPTPPEAAPASAGGPGGDASLTTDRIHLESDTQAPLSTLPEAPLDAPPPLPHHKGLVLESSIGGLGFLGQFRHVAPTAPWYHAQLGYELTQWLMLFGEGELAFTSTDTGEDLSHSYAFPIFGFGGGARVTLHATPRVAFYVQGSVGAMEADVPRGALRILGYGDAESLKVTFGGRLGVEWYQIDRHLALGLAVGARDATGFAKIVGKSDTGLMADGSAVLRYTF